MANPFDNLLNASLAASQLRQGYTQMASQERQSGMALLQRRAEQEQQNKQFIEDLGFRNRQLNVQTDNENKRLNFAYHQLRQQDNHFGIDHRFRLDEFGNRKYEFGETLKLKDTELGIMQQNANSTSLNATTNAGQLALQNTMYGDGTRGREIALESGEIQLEQLKKSLLPGEKLALPQFTDPYRGPLKRSVDSAMNQFGPTRAYLDFQSYRKDDFRKSNEYNIVTSTLDNIAKNVQKGVKLDKDTHMTGFKTALDMYEKTKHLYSDKERFTIEQNIALAMSGFGITPTQAPAEK
jgi:hypothetical protein